MPAALAKVSTRSGKWNSRWISATALATRRLAKECSITQPIALITGGSRGLGRNSALYLARAGYDLILTYHRNQAEAEAAAAEIRALGRKARILQLDGSDIPGFAGFAEQEWRGPAVPGPDQSDRVGPGRSAR